MPRHHLLLHTSQDAALLLHASHRTKNGGVKVLAPNLRMLQKPDTLVGKWLHQTPHVSSASSRCLIKANASLLVMSAGSLR
jgi:hypothetical protein